MEEENESDKKTNLLEDFSTKAEAEADAKVELQAEADLLMTEDSDTGSSVENHQTASPKKTVKLEEEKTESEEDLSVQTTPQTPSQTPSQTAQTSIQTAQTLTQTPSQTSIQTSIQTVTQTNLSEASMQAESTLPVMSEAESSIKEATPLKADAANFVEEVEKDVSEKLKEMLQTTVASLEMSPNLLNRIEPHDKKPEKTEKKTEKIVDESSEQSKNSHVVKKTFTSVVASLKKRSVSLVSSSAGQKKVKSVVKEVSIVVTPGSSAQAKKKSSPENYSTGKYPLSLLARDAFTVEKAAVPVCVFCLNAKFEEEKNDDFFLEEKNGKKIHLLKCSGECLNYFHLQCLKLKGQTNVDVSQNFKCLECTTGIRTCFQCKGTSKDLVKCPDKECGHFYHHPCLTGPPHTPPTPTSHTPTQSTPTGQKKLTPCPLHHCHTCARLGRESKQKDVDKSSLSKCAKCPTAFHFNVMCFPAETVICAENTKLMTCWTHEDESSLNSRGKGRRKTSPNPRICFFCKKGGNLLVCETCPFTADVDCAGLDAVPEGPWKCADCTKGARPMMLDIVWYKPARHRVWPCQIVPQEICPKNVWKGRPSNTAFIMRYMGCDEYEYATSQEVLPYNTYDPKWKWDPSKTPKFSAALEEARRLDREMLTLKTSYIQKLFAGSRPVYHKIKVNKPIPPVKYVTSVKKEDAHICDCNGQDSDPCGASSHCLNRDMLYECSKHCLAGILCKNQRIGKKEYPKLDIFFTANRGWALRVKEDVKQGDLVIEYVGEIITVEERNRRIKEKLATQDGNFYFLDLTNARVIDAGPAGNLARFANHSCDANTFSQKWIVDGDTHIALIATRDILAGSEITFDYRWEYESGVTSRECLCGAENCPGMIGGKTYDPTVGKQLPTVPKKTKRSSTSPARKRPRKSSSTKKKSPDVLSKKDTPSSGTSPARKRQRKAESPPPPRGSASLPPLRGGRSVQAVSVNSSQTDSGVSVSPSSSVPSVSPGI